MWYSKKKVIIPFIVFLLALTGFFVSPKLLLSSFNRLGKTEPKYLDFKADDMSFTPTLHLRVEGLHVDLKAGNKPLLRGAVMESGIDYGELLKGRILLTSKLEKFTMYYAPAYTKALIQVGRRVLGIADKYNFKLRDLAFSDIDIKDSEVIMTTYPGVNKEKFFTLHDVKGKVRNIQGSEEHPIGTLHLSALVYGKTRTHLEGQFNLKAKPEEWDLDFTLQKLNLADLNIILEKNLPMVFKQGTLDLYAEMQMKDKKVQGYVKPFFDQVKIEENEPKRELPGNFLLSILTFLYEDEKPESVSTKIPFLMKKGFTVESPGLLKTIIKHGIDQDLKRGLDHQLTL
jgi:hypothetical protein